MASAESAALAEQKRALRLAMGEKRSHLAAEDRAHAAARASARLAALPELRAAADRGACVAGFAAIRDEIDPGNALRQVSRAGARIAWPRVPSHDGGPPSGGGARLRFHLAEAADLRPGRFGIPEPDATAPELAASDIAVMLVPGLAFDGRGNRLGFGRGYFDEWLTAASTRRPAFVVGFGYDFQIVAACPANERDARVDCVVTDARVIRCQADAGRDEAGKVGS